LQELNYLFFFKKTSYEFQYEKTVVLAKMGSETKRIFSMAAHAERWKIFV
jgi:hypothetical protein